MCPLLGWHSRAPGGTRAAQPGTEPAPVGLAGGLESPGQGPGSEFGEQLVTVGQPRRPQAVLSLGRRESCWPARPSVPLAAGLT